MQNTNTYHIAPYIAYFYLSLITQIKDVGLTTIRDR
jgi:hypothetical protein